MLTWQEAWRKGLAPLLSDEQLRVLQLALATDDPCLVQGITTDPPPLVCTSDWPMQAGCLFAYMGWKGDGLETVGEVELYFARLCHEVDLQLGEPAACRWLLNAFDDTPRAEMWPALLAEVGQEQERRASQAAGAA